MPTGGQVPMFDRATDLAVFPLGRPIVFTYRLSEAQRWMHSPGSPVVPGAQLTTGPLLSTILGRITDFPRACDVVAVRPMHR